MLTRPLRFARPRARRPMLLGLVFGIFLVLVGVTASALVAIASVHLSSATLDAEVSRDASLVELFVNTNLATEDVDAGGPSAERAQLLEERLAALTADDEIERIELRTTDGAVLAASTPGLRGARPQTTPGMEAAAAGRAFAEMVGADEAGAAGPTLSAESVVEEFLPVLGEDGSPLAVVALWRDAGPLLARLDAARGDIITVTVVAALILSVVLFGVFRAAARRIARQHAQLIESERRDPLTELLNHGAVVGLLAETIESARASGGRIGLALLDIDNFRMLNETYGHDAADDVLGLAAKNVARAESERVSVARYGPDEFLVVAPGADLAVMESIAEHIRTGLAAEAVQFGDSERMPVTASVGICLFPEHADSVTELLSAAAVAVSEAKASGGDTVCVAQSGPDEKVSVGSFDVLHGLVIAVDTKDRYTKRHSEDVARYADFLAERLGLDTELRSTIRLAGLLHDVGKIGIPDGLLRKPGRLTAEEFDVFKQHVALGDAIVRDVPNVELVRSGIRHHHERWDGRGYLEGFEGEEIPVLGRILAVADAFSAMTTTRPYRKALPLEEALKRLGDAAGTQLQEELVVAFITGLESASNAPLPYNDIGVRWQLRVA